MAWQPLESLALGEYSFTPAGPATLTGSTVSAVSGVDPDWSITLTPARRARVTAVSYATNDNTPVSAFSWTGGSQENINGTTAFAPTTWETVVDVASLAYASSGPAATESYGFGLEVWVAPAECDEVGNARRCFVSAYNMAKIFRTQMYSAETGCLVGDFNGAIAPARSIVWSQWQTYGGAWTNMSEPTIAADGRSARVMLMTQWCGISVIKQTVVLDNGERKVQQYRIDVLGQPMYIGDAYSSGPQVISVGTLP